jgi:hypothetical protein
MKQSEIGVNFRFLWNYRKPAVDGWESAITQ